MGDTTGQGMTHEQVQRYVASLVEVRDRRLAEAETDPLLKLQNRASAGAIQLALSFLHTDSEGRYGEPYPWPETEKK